MATIIDNINSILNTKSELKTILNENGQEPGDVFAEYPDMFRSAIQAASENGANEEIVNAYISAYLSAYNFIDQDALSANSYLTSVPSEFITQDELSAMGYLTSVPEVDLSGYVTTDALNGMSYVSQSALSGMGYITSQSTSDWNQTNSSYASYIQNKPNLIKGSGTNALILNNTNTNSAQGNNSIAEGAGTQTHNVFEHAMGLNNKSHYTSVNAPFPDSTATLFSIGIGVTAASRTNAFEVTQTGDIYVYGVGNYDGKNLTDAQTLAYVISVLNSGGNVDLSSYVTYAFLSSQSYLTSVPSEYITDSELSACGYLTSIPSEYITDAELSACGYLTQHQDLSSYVSYSYLADQLSAYATQSYVMDKIGAIPSVDLSGYVTTDALNGMSYVSQSALSGMSYITQNDLSGMSYITQNDLSGMSYITLNDLSGMSYITLNDVPASPVIDENLIPKETATYTLGSESYLYYATYTSRVKVGNNSQIYNDGGGITLSVNNNAGIRMGSSNFYPKTNNAINLGQSSNKWNNAYISNLYADTIHNFIWTGTAAQYAALNDYTTYQIYLIQEA